MDRWATQVARLGAELGPEPAGDVVPTAATVLALLAVERGDDGLANDDVLAAAAALHRVLGRTPRPWCGTALDLALAGLDPMWAPVQAVRLAAALAAGLLAGHLPAGQPWALHVSDPVGAAGAAMGPVVDLLAGLLDGWDPTLAPPAVATNLGSLRRAGWGYRPSSGRLRSVPDLWVELDPWTRGGEGLPGPQDAPMVVVRTAAAAAADPGLPPPPRPPPDPQPMLAAAARWCFPVGWGGPEAEAAAAALLDPAWPGDELDDGAAPASWWRREVADLLLASEPDQAAAWCRRALVEAQHPVGSRRRHARLVEGAARLPGAAGDLCRHAADLRRTGPAAWASAVWAVADAALQADLAEEVLLAPLDCHSSELATALAARLEAAAAASRAAWPRACPSGAPPGR